MKKIYFVLVAVVILCAVGAIAISAQTSTSSPQSDNGSGKDSLAGQVSSYVQGFAQQQGVNSNNITGISQVDFNALPKEVNIKNVNDNNLAIYQVNYSNETKNQSIYVITYSVQKLKSQGDIIVAQDKRNFLDFGHSGAMNDSGFLETSAGVETSQAKGYVMVRDGSITAVSTDLEVIQSNPGQIQIEILKNGQLINFGNTISTDSLGVKKDYDVQEAGNVEFHAGDVISVMAVGSGNVAWRDVITMVEITTTD